MVGLKGTSGGYIDSMLEMSKRSTEGDRKRKEVCLKIVAFLSFVVTVLLIVGM